MAARKKKTAANKSAAKKSVRRVKLKTQKNEASVPAFLDAIPDDARRRDCKTVAKLMRTITKALPKMWGASIVGYGSYEYRRANGEVGEWFLAGFAPRKNDLTLYVMSGFQGREALLKRLGKHKTGKACLYLKSLEDVDMDVLEELIRSSVAHKSAASGGGC